MGPLSMEQALAAEAIAIGGLTAELEDRLKREAGGQEEGQTSERERADKNSDVRDGDEDSATQADSRRRTKFYRSLNETNRSALCLSGGGIRSATFCLGVIQALAAFDDNDIYFILAGTFDVVVNGRRVAGRSAGDHVGEMAAVQPAQKRSATVTALEDAIVAKLSAEVFSNLGSRHPQLYPPNRAGTRAPSTPT
jgi:hypothetical protein